MHIAFITVGDPARLTGGYLYHARLFAGLRDRGIAVSEIVASAADIAAQQQAVAAFGASFEPAAYDVVVVDALARIVCGPWMAGWQTQRPLLVLVHELPSVASAGEQNAAAEVPLFSADRLIAVSNHGRALLLEHGVPPERIDVVSPGFDRIAPLTRTATSATDAPLRALCVAQWIPRKNITTLLRAWRQRQHLHSRLELVGETDVDPAYAAEIRALLADQADDILVRGALPDAELAAAYAHADLFVLPTRFEGYGMVVAEALAHGLPVIAGAVGPVPDIVGAGGLTLPPDDVGALADALDRLLGNAALREAMAQAARQRALLLPSWNDTVSAFIATLERC